MGGAEGGAGSIAFGISSLLEKPTPIMFCHLEVLMPSSTRFTEDFAYEVLSVVEEIPEGNVATYGQIARLIGRDKNSRLVARVLSPASNYGDFPCHRVVNHAGRLVPGWPEQAFLLRQEGVELKDAMHVDLRKYQWEC